MLSPLQLNKSPVFTELIFSKNDDYDTEISDYSYNFEHQISYNINEDNCSIIFTLRSNDNSENIPVNICISAHGSFDIIDESLKGGNDDEQKMRIVISNCATVLYSTIRQKVITTTQQMPFSEPIILPLLLPSCFIQGLREENLD